MTHKMDYLDLQSVVPSKTNPRKNFDKKQLEELTASIKDKGVLQPVLVRPVSGNGHFEIVSGERRFRAAKAAGLKTIPAVVQELDDQTAMEIQVIENLHRSDLHPLEEAEGYEYLIKKHNYKSADEVADKVGKSRSYVYGRMKLCALLPESRKAFYEGLLNPSTALLIARIPAELQAKALKEITKPEHEDEPLSYRQAMEHIHDNYTLQLSATPFDTKDAKLLPKAGACTTCPKRTGNQAELFPDIKRADVCTDPKCFKEKREAHWARATAKLAEKGCRILGEDKEIFYGDQVNTRYVKIDDKCESDPSKRTYAQLLPDIDPKEIIVAKDNRGRPKQLLSRQTAERLLREAGHSSAKAKPAEGGEESNEQRQEREQKKRERNSKTADLILGEVIPQILEYVKGKGDLGALEFVLRQFIYLNDIDPAFFKRRGFEKRTDFIVALNKSSGQEVAALVMDLKIGNPYNDFNDRWEQDFEALCTSIDIDLKALKKKYSPKVDQEMRASESDKKKAKAKGAVEVKTGKGTTVTVTPTTELNEEDKKKAAAGAAKLAKIFGGR